MESKDEHGKKMCCPPDTEPSKDGVGCTSMCGIGDDKKVCNQGEFCNQITGLSPDDLNLMKTHAKADGTYRGDNNIDTINLCNKPIPCSWSSSTTTYLPFKTQSGPVTYYNASNIFKGDIDDVDSICIPKAPDYECDHSCFNKNKHNCDTSICEWKSSLDYYSEYGYDKFDKIMKCMTSVNSESQFGHYCGDENQQWLQYIQTTSPENGCTYQDCNNALIEPGVIKIKWDQQNGICSALKSADNNIGITGTVQCTKAGEPCSSCTDKNIGSFVNCVKCYNNGPCTECVEGVQYVPSEKCHRKNNDNGWAFKKCNDEMTYYYKSDSGGDCTAPTNCGNCPFGTNNFIDKDDFGWHGAKDGEINIACYDDGQIKTLAPKHKDPTYKLITVKHGKICHKCEDGEEGCNLNSCAENNDENSCDYPYVLNYDKNNCIYPCQIDGQNAREKPNDSDNEEGEKYFTAEKINGKTYCFRNYPAGIYKGLCNAWANSCYIANGIISNPVIANITDQNYTHINDCYSYDNQQACFMGIQDQVKIPQNLNPSADDPIYMYPKDIYTSTKDWQNNVKKPANSNMPTQCWSSTQQADFSLSAGYLNLNDASHEGDLRYYDWYDHYPNPSLIADNFCEGEPRP